MSSVSVEVRKLAASAASGRIRNKANIDFPWHPPPEMKTTLSAMAACRSLSAPRSSEFTPHLGHFDGYGDVSDGTM